MGQKWAWYNENDPKTAAWLRELITAGLIADGEVDTRSIVDVEPSDLAGFVQCHFFAGIGGWGYALRLAGWSDDRAVWTGSCPCQPWSAAGRGARADDSRDLWPTWFQLIEVCRPAVVFGEQVASADGRAWLDRVYADLEGTDYAVGAANLPAASVGAFHTRERLWVVADTERGATERHRYELAGATRGAQGAASERERIRDDAWDGGDARGLADAGCESPRRGVSGSGEGAGAHSEPSTDEPRGPGGIDCTVGHTEGARLQGQRRERGEADSDERRGLTRLSGDAWADVEWIPCIDGKARPIEPVTFPLAHGVSGRVAIRLPVECIGAEVQEHWYNRTAALKGFGNAIVPQVAAEVIAAYMEIVG